jgi:hypothetical protein
MKKTIFKKAGAIVLLGISITAITKLRPGNDKKQHTKMSAEVANNPVNAQWAGKMGGGAFWQTAVGGMVGIVGAAAGTSLAGPWGGYVGAVVGAAVGAW